MTKNAVARIPTKRTPPAPVGSAASMIGAIERAAANPAVDIEKMERLYKMAKDLKATEAEAEFNAALARVQSKAESVATNAENSHTGSRYAKLAVIDRMLKPLYTAEGLSVSFDTGEAKRPDDIRIEAILSHSGGHSRRYHIDLPRDESGAKGGANKTGVQGAGSTNTYGRRYLTCMIFAVATEDDNDGNRQQVDGLDDGVVADHLAAMDAAASIPDLQKVFATAWNAATKAKDKPSQRKFTEAKDKRKAVLAGQS